jgi:hypothetical protein
MVSSQGGSAVNSSLFFELHGQVAQTHHQQCLVGSVLQVDRGASAGAALRACGHSDLWFVTSLSMRGQRCG